MLQSAERPSISEVAVASHVSIATVSRVLNGKPGVTQEVEARVLNAIRDLKYERLRRPKRSMKSSGEMKKIHAPVACMLPPNENGFSVWNAASAFCARRLQNFNYQLGIYFASADLNTAPPHPLQDDLSIFAGLLVAERHPDNLRLLQKAAARNLPAARMGFFAVDVPVPQLVGECFSGGLQIMDYLLGKGHRRIAFWHAGAPDAVPLKRYPHISEKYAAYRYALDEAGLAFDPALIFDAGLRRARVESSAQALAAAQPTAVFIDNDFITWNFLPLLGGKGYEAFREIELAHFIETGQPPSQYGLTCAFTSADKIGTAAADCLLRALQNHPYPSDYVAKIGPGFKTSEQLKPSAE